MPPLLVGTSAAAPTRAAGGGRGEEGEFPNSEALV